MIALTLSVPGGLIDALRVERHGTIGGAEPVVEQRQVARRHIGDRGDGFQRRRGLARGGQRLSEAGCVTVGPGRVARTALSKMDQEPSEHGDIAARAQREVEIGDIAGRGTARVDHHDPRAARRARLDESLIEHRMAPGGIAADQHDKIGRIKVLIAAGHDVGAKGTGMPGDR
jgi:hypothetical protein